MNSINVTINIDSQGFAQKPRDAKDLNFITGRIRAKAPTVTTRERCLQMNSINVTINIDSQGFAQKPRDAKDLNFITGRIRAKAPTEVSLEELCDYIAKGHTFISGCVVDPDLKKLSASNTQNYAFFGLDIDNKGFQITPKQMIEEVKAKLGEDVVPTIYYETFTSTAENKRFRLLYFFEKPIQTHPKQMIEEVKAKLGEDVVPTIYYETFTSTAENKRFRLLYFFEKPIQTHQEFKAMYNRLKILFPECIDQSTSNANRLWFGTNKANSVRINRDFKLLGDDFFKRLEKIVPLDTGGGIARKEGVKYLNCELKKPIQVYERVWFHSDEQSVYELAEYVRTNVSIVDYVELMGADLKDCGDYYNCSCPFHRGDNETAFVIYKATNSAFCFSKQCVAGDVINLCKIFENKTYFEAIKTLGDNETAFVIYKATNSAFCFSKQCVAGDVINLCKIFENKTYFEAIKTLLNRFELDVPMKFINMSKSYRGLK